MLTNFFHNLIKSITNKPEVNNVYSDIEAAKREIISAALTDGDRTLRQHFAEVYGLEGKQFEGAGLNELADAALMVEYHNYFK